MKIEFEVGYNNFINQFLFKPLCFNNWQGYSPISSGLTFVHDLVDHNGLIETGSDIEEVEAQYTLRARVGRSQYVAVEIDNLIWLFMNNYHKLYTYDAKKDDIFLSQRLWGRYEYWELIGNYGEELVALGDMVTDKIALNQLAQCDIFYKDLAIKRLEDKRDLVNKIPHIIERFNQMKEVVTMSDVGSIKWQEFDI